MKNVLSIYSVTSPTVFANIATLSGLAVGNTLIRLSPELIDALAGTTACLTTAAISAFTTKYKSLSGDCYVALTSDVSGNQVLALDVVRPDKIKGTTSYVMDQEPIYIRNLSGWNGATEARKITHLSCDGRTFDLSSYDDLSSYLDTRRDQPVSWSEISLIDPGICSAITQGMKVAFQ